MRLTFTVVLTDPAVLLLRIWFLFVSTSHLYFVLADRYNQKPLTGLIDPGQMYDVCAVPSEAGETLEILWMRR